MTCRWRWKTSCPASRPLLILTAYPPSPTPSFSATVLATSKSRLTTVSGRPDLLQVRNVLPGDDENVDGCLAIYVFEGQHIVLVVNHLCI